METVAGITAITPPKVGEVSQAEATAQAAVLADQPISNALVTLQVEESDFISEEVYKNVRAHFRKLYFIEKQWYSRHKRKLTTIFPSFLVTEVQQVSNAGVYTSSDTSTEFGYRSTLIPSVLSSEVVKTIQKLYSTHYLLLPIRRYKTSYSNYNGPAAHPEFIGCKFNREYSNSAGARYLTADFILIDACIACKFGEVNRYEVLSSGNYITNSKKKRSSRMQAVLLWADKYLNEFMAMGGL